MRKGVWLGGVILSLCGGAGQLVAQTTTWSAAPRLATPNCQSLYTPSAAPSLGRPQPAAVQVRGQSPDDQTGVQSSQFASQRLAQVAQPGQVTQAAQAAQAAQAGLPAQGTAPDDPAILLMAANGPIGVPLPPIGSTTIPTNPPPRTLLSTPVPNDDPPPPVRQPTPVDNTPGQQTTLLPPIAAPVNMAPTINAQAPIMVAQDQPMPTVPSQPTLPAPNPEGPVTLPQAVPPPLSFHPPMEPGEAWYDPNAHSTVADNFYIRAEYLLWWIKNDHVPALFTTSNTTDMGTLGAPSTQVLFGGSLDRNPFSGMDVTAGFWLDCDHDKSLEIEGFFLGQKSASFQTGTNNDSVIARPFTDVVNNRQAAELLSFPGLSTGVGSVNAPSSLWGISPDLRCKLCCGCDYQIDGLVGVRYLDLTESIQINESIQASSTAPAPFTNSNATLTDFFRTHDQFYGGEVGLAGEQRWGSWFIDWRGKVAVGDTHESLLIDGSQQITNRITGQVTTTQGGLLALNSNIGRYSHDSFGVVPELNLHLGYAFTEHIRASVGYDFLYWSSVIRPGDQIDTGLDVNRIPNFIVPPGTPTVDRPAVPFKETSFYANGLNISLEITF